MIYKWHPLIIGEINGNKFRTIHTYETLPFFKNIRGSCNGIEMDHIGETWFLCHTVSYEDRRYYYHIIVMIIYNIIYLLVAYYHHRQKIIIINFSSLLR
jgi:hypothetical protein